MTPPRAHILWHISSEHAFFFKDIVTPFSETKRHNFNEIFITGWNGNFQYHNFRFNQWWILFSCDQAALWMVLSVRPPVRLSSHLLTRGQFSGIGVACVCLCDLVFVCVCVNHLLVRAITRGPFKLGSPNLNQRCKALWLRSLLFWGAIDLDLQGQN